VIVKFAKLVALAGVVALSSSCGDFVRQGQSPVLLVMKSLRGASGADPTAFSGVLHSDVITMRIDPAPCSDTTPCPTVWADNGEVVLSLQLKDQGSLGGIDTPSLTNQVQIDRYRVEYRRSDGRNTQGVDVPFAFDSAVTFAVLPSEDAVRDFQLVRHVAKAEAPLASLAASGNVIATIATVTFYGHDMAGNQISVTGNIGVDFGDFADPQ
jgi:hypothetical protein